MAFFTKNCKFSIVVKKKGEHMKTTKKLQAISFVKINTFINKLMIRVRAEFLRWRPDNTSLRDLTGAGGDGKQRPAH